MFPKRKDLFDAWHKAMVAGATVDKPNYGKTTQSSKSHRKSNAHMKARRRRRRKKRKSNAQA